MTRFFTSLTKYISLFFLASCGNSEKPLKVGVTAGPHAIIMEEVKKVCKKQGLDIEITEFNDFILPNMALEQNELDVNSFQHEPYLKEQISSRGYDFAVLGKTVLMPMGIYSAKFNSLQEIKDNAQIGIPNDPSNGARALKLLEKAGILKLKESVEVPSVLDVAHYNKKIAIIEMEAPQLYRSLEDLDAIITNTDWVVLANGDPSAAFYAEEKDSPYVNVLVVKSSQLHKPEMKKFLDAYHSEEIKEYIVKTFQGAVIPAF